MAKLNADVTGKILNLISNDVLVIDFMPYLIISPLQTLAVVYILVYKVDLTFLSGLLILIIFFPLQFILAKIFSYFK